MERLVARPTSASGGPSSDAYGATSTALYIPFVTPPAFKYHHGDINRYSSPASRELFNSVGSSLDRSSEQGDLPDYCELIVNCIPLEMKVQDLTTMFRNFDSVTSAKFVRDSTTGRSMGFVKYTKPHFTQKALAAMNGLKIGSEEIKVSYARPGCKDIKDATLYVNYLPSCVRTSAQLEEIFSPFGKIIASRLLLDSEMKPCGVGFVQFNVRQEAAAAVYALNGVVLEPSGGRPLVVKFPRGHFDGVPSQVKNVVYVDNLDSSVSETTLKAVFRQFGAVYDVFIVKNHCICSKNSAFVTMASFASAQAAINHLNGRFVGTKRINVAFRHSSP
ncbi:ELAV-like protein 2 [Cloeon dipterum]|uniref:ELAV-like protein 2 n=1 Tax=Cloeon dipterum TaxID=197152 RepID=UPI00321F978E